MISIDLDPETDAILLVGGYTPGLGKTVPGARFVPKQPGHPAHWTMPRSLSACYALRERFGRELRVGRDLSAWAREEIARVETMKQLGKSRDAELQRVPSVSPVLDKAMANRRYQRVGARFVAEGRNVLLGPDPGLGKTLMAIGGIIESGVPGPYLVVAPKTATHAVWKNEIPRWWPGAEVITVPDGRAVREQVLDDFVNAVVDAKDGLDYGDIARARSMAQTFLVVHPEMLRIKRWWACPKCEKLTPWKAGRKSLDCVSNFEHLQDFEPKHIKMVEEVSFPQLFEVEFGAAVVDECDRILIRRNASQTQVRNGAESLRIRPEGLRITMSGTPMRGKPHLLWGHLNWMLPKVYTSMWRWVEQHWSVSNGWAGSRVIGDLRNEEGLYAELDQIMYRVTKAEVAPDLPAKTYVGTPVNGSSSNANERDVIGVWLPMEPEQKRAYDQICGEGIARLEGGELNPIGVLAELTRLKQFATASGRLDADGTFVPKLPSNKFDYLLAQLEEWGFPDEPREKVIVVSQFTQVLDLFAAALRAKMDKEWIKSRGGSDMVCMLTGRVTGAAREETIRRFNEEVGTDSPHVMFLNVKAGGVAITIDSADHMIILDETWVPDDMTQVEDRIHRVSRPRPVFYHYVRSIDTVEQHIAETALELALTNHEVLDGRRGLEFSRKVVSKL